MKHAALFPAFASLLALAACNAAAPPINNNCPNVAVLEQASTVTDFLPGRQDVAAQITQARITGVAGSCTLEKKKQQLLRVTFQAGFAAVNGPANTSPTLALPYMVSISQGNTIVSRNYYQVLFKFSGNVSSASATSKPVTVELPNTADAANTDILVAFYLTPDQLNYNLTHPAQ